MGQVISGKRYWPGGTPVAGQQFEYGFDDIGNRKNTKTGGDVNGFNLRTANYSANLLNQYSSRTVPGFLNILGQARTNATVTLWSATQLVRRHADVPEKGGDYLLQIKGNQPKLLQQAQGLDALPATPSFLPTPNPATDASRSATSTLSPSNR